MYVRSRRTLVGQVVAFLAAGLMVCTAYYVFILWRNFSPERVFNMQSGHMLYHTNDFAIGSMGGRHVTLLRFTPDGGWVIAGNANWLNAKGVNRYAEVALVPENSVGPMGTTWLCVVRSDPQIDQIELYDPRHPKNSDTFSFHGNGIVEPVTVSATSTLIGLHGNQVLFKITPGAPDASSE